MFCKNETIKGIFEYRVNILWKDNIATSSLILFVSQKSLNAAKSWMIKLGF